MKADFLFADINVNIIIHKNVHFMDQGLKIRGIKYFKVDTRLLFAPTPIKISGYAPGSEQFWLLYASL